MERVAITGGTGMLGRALTERLVAQGVHVLLLVNPRSKRLAGITRSKMVEVVPCDIAQLAAFQVPDGKPYDAFYHLAWGGTFGDARNEVYVQEANIRYALDAVRAAKRLGCRRFIGAGSQAEYGRVEGALHPDTPCDPENGYGIAKLSAGRLTRILCAQEGIEHVWTRILSVYGPNDGAQTMVMSTIDTLLDGRVPRFTPCEQLWDYLYRDDAAEALYLVGEKGHDGSVYPIGSGQARPLREFVLAIRDAIDANMAIDIGALPYNDKQVMHLHADIRALTDDTGFRPQIGFEEGVRKTVDWVRAQR